MKTIIPVPTEVTIKYVRCFIPVRYDEEDIPYDFPHRKNNTWSILIDIDSGQIQDWPQGFKADVHMKVCDEGSYYLENDECITLLKIENDYVPNQLLPGRYGDYIDFKVNENGIITNWPKSPSIEDFETDNQ